MTVTTEQKRQNTDTHYEWHYNPVWYWIIRTVFVVVFHTLWPLRVTGQKNVPRKGAAVIVSNHLSMVDPLVVGYAANRLVCFMAKQELFRSRPLGFIVSQVGAFPVDRSKPSIATLRTAMMVLQSGRLLGMFPEGHRSTTGDLQEFRVGALRIAARARVPIVPAAVYRTDRALPPGKFLRPSRISVTFGPAFEVTELYDRNDKGEPMERAMATLRERIRALHDAQAGRK